MSVGRLAAEEAARRVCVKGDLPPGVLKQGRHTDLSATSLQPPGPSGSQQEHGFLPLELE